MCNGFGAIVTKDDLYFCEFDAYGDISHTEIINRLGWRENADQFIRPFVRVECADWTMQSFRFDEHETLPGWVDEDEQRQRVEKTLERAASAWENYKAVRAPAWENYKAVRAPAWENYKAVRDQAWENYEAVCAQAWETYEAVRAQSWKRMRETLKSIPGYVPAA